MSQEWKQQAAGFKVLSETKDTKVQYWEPDGANGTFVISQIQGLTVDDFRSFFSNYADETTIMMSAGADKGILSFRKLESVDGRPLYHHRTVPPVVIVSPRSNICSWYTIDEGTSIIFMISSLGNETIKKQYTDLLGSDV